MKRLITALAVVTALSAVPALAADMPIKAPPQPVAAPAYSWTGFHVGANGGYGWKDLPPILREMIFCPQPLPAVAVLAEPVFLRSVTTSAAG